MFKGFLKLSEEVIPGSESYSSASNRIFPEGICPGQGRPFSHVQEGKGDFLHISVIGCLIDCEVKLDGVQPGDLCFIGAIKGFGFAKLELGRFYCGR